MKRTLAFILLILLLATACGSNDAPASDSAAAGEEAAVQPGDATDTVFRAPT